MIWVIKNGSLGSMVPCFFGSMVPWFYGSLVQRPSNYRRPGVPGGRSRRPPVTKLFCPGAKIPSLIFFSFPPESRDSRPETHNPKYHKMNTGPWSKRPALARTKKKKAADLQEDGRQDAAQRECSGWGPLAGQVRQTGCSRECWGQSHFSSRELQTAQGTQKLHLFLPC